MEATPAQSLLNATLGHWEVFEKCPKKATSTGGFHSVQYKVKHTATAHIAFLKAIDLFADEDATDVKSLEGALRNFNYEAELLKLCEDRLMDGVVRSLDNGLHKVRVAGFSVMVPYIVFEQAEGDVRTHELAQTFDLSWRLRIFHGLCVAMRQLHSAGIAHQDVKPSNVLVFEGKKSKIADLGRATMQTNPSAFEMREHVGDCNYWPLELLYRDQTPVTWQERRMGADFFMMGCVLAFLITDSSFLTLVFERLPQQFWPDLWAGTYQDVAPHILQSQAKVLQEIRTSLPESMAGELVEFVKSFTHPNPKLRGFLRSKISTITSTTGTGGSVSSQYDLEYVISRIDHLATHAQMQQCAPPKWPNNRSFLELLSGR